MFYLYWFRHRRRYSKSLKSYGYALCLESLTFPWWKQVFVDLFFSFWKRGALQYHRYVNIQAHLLVHSLIFISLISCQDTCLIFFHSFLLFLIIFFVLFFFFFVTHVCYIWYMKPLSIQLKIKIQRNLILVLVDLVIIFYETILRNFFLRYELQTTVDKTYINLMFK